MKYIAYFFIIFRDIFAYMIFLPLYEKFYQKQNFNTSSDALFQNDK